MPKFAVSQNDSWTEDKGHEYQQKEARGEEASNSKNGSRKDCCDRNAACAGVPRAVSSDRSSVSTASSSSSTNNNNYLPISNITTSNEPVPQVINHHHGAEAKKKGALDDLLESNHSNWVHRSSHHHRRGRHQQRSPDQWELSKASSHVQLQQDDVAKNTFHSRDYTLERSTGETSSFGDSYETTEFYESYSWDSYSDEEGDGTRLGLSDCDGTASISSEDSGYSLDALTDHCASSITFEDWASMIDDDECSDSLVEEEVIDDDKSVHDDNFDYEEFEVEASDEAEVELDEKKVHQECKELERKTNLCVDRKDCTDLNKHKVLQVETMKIAKHFKVEKQSDDHRWDTYTREKGVLPQRRECLFSEAPNPALPTNGISLLKAGSKPKPSRVSALIARFERGINPS